MSNIINPKPRFGFNPTTGLIYDYVLQRDVAVVTDYAGSDGVWDLTQVKAAILAGNPIESARKSVIVSKMKVSGQQPAPVAKTPAPTVAQNAEGFSPIQLAALGITAAELAKLSVAQKAAIAAKVSPARAIALKLTAAQKLFLGIKA